MNKKSIIVAAIFLLNSTVFADPSITTTPPTNSPSTSDITNTTSLAQAVEFLSPWARPSMSSTNNNSALYLTIKNNSDTDYTFVGASAIAIANDTELHKTYVDEKGISRMTKVDKIVIPHNSEIELKPGGTHIMLNKLKRSLNVGDKFKVELKFEELGTKTIEVEVIDKK